MPAVTLPDGSQRQYEHAISVAEVAADIGAGLARAAIGGRINGALVDTSHVIDTDAELAIVTAKDEDGLEIIRHSTAHLLAQAVKSLYPEAQVTIGPVIEDGFYYDFAYQRPFTPEDFQAIEKRMGELAKQNFPITRSEQDRDEAVQFFTDLGETYKAQIIADIPADAEISLYQQGDFVDLCRGPHVPATGHLKAFKLTKLAGAYWRGDSNNEMLQRIYGTAWANRDQLDAYLQRIEEAEKRDHRKIAKQLNLFHLQEEAPGMIFWHPNGWTIYQQVEQYIRQVMQDNGYQEVRTPLVVDRKLWEQSGHWENFAENMFTTQSENRDYAIKPMNCPGHIQIYNRGLHSYRDLPLRLSEFGSCHRNEPSGTLHGLMRLRNFVQDDAHIFCAEEQIQQEVDTFIDLLFEVYQAFGFPEIEIQLSTRPEQRVGSDAIWDKAESALEHALNDKGLDWKLQPGEGAFYGPKVEFSLRDSLQRVWQCGTIQVDFSMPERLDAHYITENGSRKTPVMLHRAILGSLERFIGILIEEHAGIMPTWLSPTQVAILNITDEQADYSTKIAETLQKQHIRTIADLRNEKIGYKIREHTLQRVPYLLVVGNRERESSEVAVRTRGGEDLGSMSLTAFLELINADIASRGHIILED